MIEKTKSVISGAAHIEQSNKLLDTNCLSQLVQEPTRITATTSTCLDILLVSNPSLAETVKVIPGFSDHIAFP